jgi:hypothetical protein
MKNETPTRKRSIVLAEAKCKVTGKDAPIQPSGQGATS